MQNNTTFIVLVTVFCTLWSGLISWRVANWSLNKQARIDAIKDIVRLIYRLISSSEAFWISKGRNEIEEAELIHKL